MYGRKAWRAHTIECKQLKLDGICMQKKDLLVLLERQERCAEEDNEPRSQVHSEEAITASKVQLACERECLSLHAKLHGIKELVEHYVARVEMLEQHLEGLLEMERSLCTESSDTVSEQTPQLLTKAQEIPLPSSADGFESAETTEKTPSAEKELIKCTKKGRRFFRSDTGAGVLKKDVLEIEGDFFLK